MQAHCVHAAVFCAEWRPNVDGSALPVVYNMTYRGGVIAGAHARAFGLYGAVRMAP